MSIKLNDVASAITLSESHIDLRLRITANASKDQITGLVQTSDTDVRLAVKIGAIPQKGMGNKAIIRLLAGKLGVGKANISIVSGATTRLKTLRIEGDPQQLVNRLAGLV